MMAVTYAVCFLGTLVVAAYLVVMGHPWFGGVLTGIAAVLMVMVAAAMERGSVLRRKPDPSPKVTRPGLVPSAPSRES